MNLILLNDDELADGLDRDDPRVSHIVDVLKCGPEDWFDIGIQDGPRGKARIVLGTSGKARFEFELHEEPPDLYPITLIVGMPRPQTARRLLREMTSMGAGRIWFANTDRSEVGYSTSKLWTTGEFERHVRTGAEQAFCTRLPEIARFDSLDAAVGAAEEGQPSSDRVALDNYEATAHLSELSPDDPATILAIGAERGWSAAERKTLRAGGFRLFGLGERVLRVETAAIAAFTLVLQAQLHAP